MISCFVWNYQHANWNKILFADPCFPKSHAGASFTLPLADRPFSSAYLPTLIFQLPTYVLCDSSTISSLTAITKSHDFPRWGTWATDGWRVTAHGQGRWLAVRVWRYGMRWGWATFRQVRCATGSLPLTMLSQPAFLRYTVLIWLFLINYVSFFHKSMSSLMDFYFQKILSLCFILS